MPRRAFSPTERLDDGWDELIAALADRIVLLRHDESRYLVQEMRPTWRVRLLRRGHTFGAELRGMTKHGLPLDVQTGLMDQGWGVRTHARDDRPSFAVLWEPEQSVRRPTLRQSLTGRATPDWITPADLGDAAEFLVATLRGPLHLLAAAEVVIR